MPAIASATINGINSRGNNAPVQDMVGIPRAAGAGSPTLTQMQNGHIGASLTAPAVTPSLKAQQIAEDLTPCLNAVGALWTWKIATGLWSV